MKEILSRIWNDGSFVERLARTGWTFVMTTVGIMAAQGQLPVLNGTKSWYAAPIIAGLGALGLMIPAGQKNSDPEKLPPPKP